MKLRLYVSLAGIILAIVLIPGCPGLFLLPAATQFEVVRAALDAYLGGTQPALIEAANVHAQIQDGCACTTPFVLSTRSTEDYAKGHVPGAAIVFWRKVAEPGALAGVPSDRQIVVYCYSGHTAALATVYLNLAGYHAVNMKYGMFAWTRDQTVRAGQPFDDATDGHDYPTEATDNTPAATHDLPELDVTPSTDPAEIIRAAADAYLQSTKPPLITAETLHTLLYDGDDTNDPVILSVRSAADYARGHVPGAINIPWKTVAQLENLRKLPPDRPIIVYCESGHTAGLVTMALNMLGYDATNLKFGIASWTRDATVRAAEPFNDATDAHDYEVVR